MAYRKYDFVVNNFQQSQNVNREHNCNGITATNVGDVIVKVNNKILFPSTTPTLSQGDSVSFGGNEDEIYVGFITIAFDANTAGINPNVEITQKYYIADWSNKNEPD